MSVRTASIVPSRRVSSTRVGSTLPYASSLTISLSSLAHVLVMSLFSILHLFCGLYLITVARLYWYIDQPFMIYYANLLELGSSPSYMFWGYIFMCMSILHLIEIMDIFHKSVIPHIMKIWRSQWKIMMKIESRKQIQGPQSGPMRELICTTVNHANSMSIRTHKIWLTLIHSQVCIPLKHIIRVILSRQGLLGIEGEHFEIVFLIRKIIEIAAQIYQTHRSSTLLTRRSINHLLVGMLVLNCWTSLLFHWTFRGRPRFQRVVCIISDTVLCALMVIMVPMVIFLPYLHKFNTSIYDFDIDMLYDDTKFVALISENKSIFISSLPDGLSKVIPHITIWSSLHVLRTVFRIRKNTIPETAFRVWGLSKWIAMKKKHVIAPVPLRPDTKFDTTTRFRTWRPPKHSHWWNQTIYGFGLHSLVSVLLVCVSMIVLYLHIAAGHRTQVGSELSHGCKQQTSPWFATKFTCAVYEFNCYREKVESPNEHALDTLDESALVILILSHCTALVVPPSFQTLKGLIGFEIYNSTLVEWSIDASVHSEIHTRLGYTIISHVNLTHFPDGLLVPLPQSLTDIEIVHTNLTTFPTVLQWKSMAVLYLEYNQFKEYPSFLTQIDIGDLSLIGNHLTILPSEAFRYSTEWFCLSYNPIQSLPMEVHDTTAIGFLGLEYTQVAVLPDWVSNFVDQVIYVKGTPFCTRLSAHHTSVVNCIDESHWVTGRYPYELMASLRIP